MLKRYFKNIPWFLVTFVVLLYRVYNYVPLEAYTQLMTLSSLIIYIYMIYKTGNSFCSSDFKIERMIIVSLLATLIISVFYWNLNLINVLARYFPAVSILIVFYLKSQRIECSKIEKAIVILTWLYLFCWLIQVFMLPQIIFGGRDETDNLSRGFIRFGLRPQGPCRVGTGESVLVLSEEGNSACLSRCSGGLRPLFELCVEPAGVSKRCTGVSVPLRVVPSPTGLPSKRCPGIGLFSRVDRDIGVARDVAPPTWLVSNFLVRLASS